MPTLGLKGVRAWLDKRCEAKVARLGPIPAPTQPLPWDHFRRMPQRLLGGRHHILPPMPAQAADASTAGTRAF